MIGCDVLYSAYDVIQKVGVMSFKRGCDDKDRVGVMSDTAGVMSCMKWM